ncbi:hypothetical protein FQ707_06670 [Bacteroidaceae bacterium HV4-6-C5C]|jgi:hypothetical protein|nr:hypothetical protein FQ707_06670 [Bacteroidaceae bacterium HV4-6-C5C]
MKRIIFMLFVTLNIASCSASMEAYSQSSLRQDTRFLTDKMAYELNLSTGQYNDVYEINFDFVNNVRYLMDDVLRGNQWALDRYYEYLDVRNDDLRWVLSRSQYMQFLQIEYFFRPIYTSGVHWHFRIYTRYSDRHYFYFSRPYNYRSYRGDHYRTSRNNESYYRGRYDQPSYSGSFRIQGSVTVDSHRRTDFGSVQIKPNSGREPHRDDIYTTRPSNESSRGRRSEGNDRNNRESSSPNSTRNVDSNRSSSSRSKNSSRESSRSRENNETQRSSVRGTDSNRGGDNAPSTQSSRSSRSSDDRR